MDTAAAGAGALTVEYYDGSDWTELTVTDGTASGGNTLAQDGTIDWQIPADWALKGNAELDSDKYYVRLSTESVPATAPDADLIAPVDGRWLTVAFAQMDFSGPLGRPRPEEIFVSDRNTNERTCSLRARVRRCDVRSAGNFVVVPAGRFSQ